MASNRAIVGVACLTVVAGCDAAFGLTRGPDAPPPPPDAPIDAPPPEVCAYSGATRVMLDTNSIVPLHDFASDGDLAMVSGFITAQNVVSSRTGALTRSGASWIVDPSTRDAGAGGLFGARPILGDPTHLYAVAVITVTTYIVAFSLEGAGWLDGARLPIDERERLGNVRTFGSRRVFVTTQFPVPGDPYTFLKLRVADGAAWDQQDRMAAINAAQIPDLGVLTRDGLTLIYSARPRSAMNYDLFVSTRSDLDASFPVGSPITALASPADEVEPWIEDTCDRLYFRRGPSYFSGTVQPSEIWLAQP